MTVVSHKFSVIEQMLDTVVVHFVLLNIWIAPTEGFYQLRRSVSFVHLFSDLLATFDSCSRSQTDTVPYTVLNLIMSAFSRLRLYEYITHIDHRNMGPGVLLATLTFSCDYLQPRASGVASLPEYNDKSWKAGIEASYLF